MKLKEINLYNVILTLSVVLIHLTSTPVSTLQKDSIWYLIMFAINKSLCFVVPAFIFLSDFKLCNKYKNEKMDVKKFYLRKNKENCSSLFAFAIDVSYLLW